MPSDRHPSTHRRHGSRRAGPRKPCAPVTVTLATSSPEGQLRPRRYAAPRQLAIRIEVVELVPIPAERRRRHRPRPASRPGSRPTHAAGAFVESGRSSQPESQRPGSQQEDQVSVVVRIKNVPIDQKSRHDQECRQQRCRSRPPSGTGRRPDQIERQTQNTATRNPTRQKNANHSLAGGNPSGLPITGQRPTDLVPSNRLSLCDAVRTRPVRCLRSVAANIAAPATARARESPARQTSRRTETDRHHKDRQPADLMRHEPSDRCDQKRRDVPNLNRHLPPKNQPTSAAGKSPNSVNRNIMSR